MASNTIFMAVPLGTATNYKWQGLFRDLGDQGYKVFWAAAAIADMAADGGRGGRLLDGQGEPLSALQICTRLGVEASWAEKIMFPSLIFLGEGRWGEDGGWSCTSPMISKTLEWQNSTVKALPDVQPKVVHGNNLFTRTLTDAEYKAWQRKCLLPDGVFLRKNCPKKAKGKCPKKSENCPLLSENCPEIEGNNFRTDDVEDTEIVDEKKCPENPNIKEVKGNKKAAAEKTGQLAAASSPTAFETHPQNLLPGEVEVLLAGLPHGCRVVVSRHLHLSPVLLCRALNRLQRRITDTARPLPNAPGWLQNVLTAPDFVDAPPATPLDKKQQEAEAWAAEMSPTELDYWSAEGLKYGNGGKNPLVAAFERWQYENFCAAMCQSPS